MKFPSFVRLFGERWQKRGSSRKRMARNSSSRSRQPRLLLEGLEERTLMSVLPPPTFVGTVNISDVRGNESNPTVAVDPNNANNAVAAWTRNDPALAPGPQVITEAAFTNNGGSSWFTFGFFSNQNNPNQTQAPFQFPESTDVSVAYDRNGFFYVLRSDNTGVVGGDPATSRGVLVLSKFDARSGSPVQLDLDPNTSGNDKLIYRWQGADPALTPTMVIDTGVASYIDSNGVTRTNPSSNNIYVAWSTRDATPFQNTPGNTFFESILLTVSSNGGVSFSTPVQVDDSSRIGSDRNAYPRLSISQGRAANPALGITAIPPGQVNVVWHEFNNGRNANPPIDFIQFNSATGGRSVEAAGTIGGIIDGFDPGNNQPHISTPTVYGAPVALTDPLFVLSDINVTVALTHPTLAELSITLVSPSGPNQVRVSLVLNSMTNGGQTIMGIGATGANMGMLNGQVVGTTFDDEALRNLRSPAATAPYIGSFQTDTFGLGLLQGLRDTDINGIWTLEVEDHRQGNVGFLNAWKINITSGLVPNNSFATTITTTTVRGDISSNNFPLAPAASPVRGIGPAPVIASDNTLDRLSPFQGRLYVAYVDRTHQLVSPANPADNTDIYLLASDNGGQSWFAVHTQQDPFTGLLFDVPVNDDLAETDGFSEAFYDFPGIASQGRAQYMPSIVVDAVSGTVVMSWYDARHDASRSRVSTYLATSIDGGATFGKETFANQPQSAVDVITQQTVVLGPIPDNPGRNNDTRFGFGTRQGLAVSNGRIYPVWAGNLNGGADTRATQSIFAAPAIIATGPRVVASTMGPVKGITVSNGQTTFTFNDQFNGDGIQMVDGFLVTFDRLVDVATFDVTDVDIRYRDVSTPGSAPGVKIDATSVTALDGAEAARQFLVRFQPQAGVGTYSYSIGSDIRDIFRSVTTVVTPMQTATFVAPPGQVNLRIPPSGGFGTTLSVVNVNGIPSNQVVTDVNVTVSLTYPFLEFLQISLIGPDGTRVPLKFVFNGATGSNLTNTTFDDQATSDLFFGVPPYTGRFRPDSPLANLQGKAPNGNWTLEILQPFSVAPNISGLLTAWSLALGTGTISQGIQTGNRMDQNGNGIAGEDPALTGLTPGDVYAVPTPTGTGIFNGTHLTPPYASDTLPLIVPGPHIVSTQVPNNPASADNNIIGAITVSGPTSVPLAPGSVGTPGVTTTAFTVLDDYTIESAIVELDISHANARDLEVTLITPGGQRITLIRNGGTTGANLTNTTFDDAATQSIVNGKAPFASRFQPLSSLNTVLRGQTVTGNYSLEIRNSGAPGVLNKWAITFRKSAAVNAIDVTFDRNMDPSTFDATDILRIVGPNGLINPMPTYPATGLPLAIPDNTGVSLVSSLTINDSFTLSDLNLTLNISHPQVGNLTIALRAPDGTQVTLFSNLAGGGANFTNTLLDDQATTSITLGTAPYTGAFRPTGALSAFRGKSVKGTWQLIVTDSVSGTVGTLLGWSLTTQSITPNPNQNDPNPLFPRTFRIGFPQQVLPGQYSITLSPEINARSTTPGAPGDKVDRNLNAGVDVLRGQAIASQAAPPIPVTVNSTDVPVILADAVPSGSGPLAVTRTSTLTVTADFVLSSLTVRLNITHSNDPDLTAVLVSPDGTRVTLFSNVGSTGSRANFLDTVFDDLATTPIQNGGPPFLGRFNPQLPLSAFSGKNVNGVWRLEVTDSTPNNTGRINSWSITFQRPVLATGLGETGSDQTPVSFRIFNMDQTSPTALQNWTPVGPASIGPGAGTGAGRVTGLAIDPSDPSGNTVFIGGASGGVWKTTNFLTTDPRGPTYVPVTDFGPTFSLNIGGLAVFGRNNDTRQSIVFVATGEGDSLGLAQGVSGSRGIGFLRSMDGGATWAVLDSTTNVDAQGNILPINDPRRDHVFSRNGGTSTFKILVDPRPTPTGEVIVYAAVYGNNGNGNGGVWRSTDTGKTWQKMRAGQVTDIVLDPNSGTVNAVSNPTGNLQIIYAGFLGEGILTSPNRGQTWNTMPGNIGKPYFQDADISPPNTVPIPVTAPSNTPNGAKGRIVLAKPELTGDPVVDVQYQGWLWAAVVTTDNRTDGVYLTKDFGQNWTPVHLFARLPINNVIRIIPTNDSNGANAADFNVVGDQGNYDITLTVDPLNPNIAYFGGQAETTNGGLVRIDATAITDPHAFFLGNDKSDGGALRGNTNDPVQLDSPTNPPSPVRFPFFDPEFDTFLNLIRNPAGPFVSNSTFYATNTQRMSNAGTGVKWTPFDGAGLPDPLFELPLAGNTAGVDYHRAFAFKDPLTGLSRFVFANDHGVYTVVTKADGSLVGSIGDVENNATYAGNTQVPIGSRNGNLQITQFYYGASQPSELAAQITTLRQGMFYGEAQDDGFPISDPDILRTGQLRWTPPGRGDGGGVATDQQGNGTVYEYNWPCCGGNVTDFFRVNGIGRTLGLIQQSNPGNVPDPQWPFTGVLNFGVNPLNSNQVIIGSAGTDFGVTTGGKVFATTNQAVFWSEIGNPASFVDSTGANPDGTTKLAFAYGAPQPNDPVGGINNFLYVGSVGGRIFVTFTGGGNTPGTNAWIDISAGLDGSPVRSIVTNPTRGSREAYAVTAGGVFYMADSRAATPIWVNITGNLFSITHDPFDNSQNNETLLRDLHVLVADWRYTIPDSPGELINPISPPGPTHPILYAAGEGGVYRTLDKGSTWTIFPNIAVDGATREGGLLPNVVVTDLDLALGNINPDTGRPDTANGPSILLASTFGRGSFAIRLSPLVFPQSLRLDPNLPAPRGSDTGTSPIDKITNELTPVINGFGPQSAFGNLVRIDLIDLDAPGQPVINKSTPSTYAAPGLPLAIPDATTPAAPLSSSLTINEAFLIGDLNVALNINHPRISDLDIVLQGPDGTRVRLAANVGGAGANFTGTVFDDASTTLIGNGVAPFTGVFRPVEALTAFNGKAAKGTWTLIVTDTVTGSIGTLTDWSLTATPSNTTDASGRFSVQVNAGVYPADGSRDGTRRIGVRATDASGTIGSVQVFTFELSTAPVILTNTVKLSVILPNVVQGVPPRAGSDSGVFDNDGITNVITPVFIGRVDQVAPVTVEIFDVTNPANPILIGTTTTDAQGNFQVITPAGIYLNNGTRDGVKTIRVRAFNNPATPAVQDFVGLFTLDTIAPGGIQTLDLSGFTDTGASNSDHITSSTTPAFIGRVQNVADAGAQIFINAQRIVNGVPTGNPVVIGFGTVSATGEFTISTSLTVSGTYRITATLADVAGNLGGSSNPLAPPLQLILTPPSTPLISLDPSTDTGAPNDNRTAAVPQIYNGTVQAGVTVVIRDAGTNTTIGPFNTTQFNQPQVVRVNGVTVATFTQTDATHFRLSWSLTDGVHVITVQTTDIAGNVSTSAPLQVIVDREALDADSKFVREIYSIALGRTGSLNEWNRWVPLLSQPDGRRLVANGIERSTEARRFLVTNWYRTYLGRTPGNNEELIWVNALLSGATEEQTLSAILGSAEYLNRSPSVPGVGGGTPSDATFVRALYLQLLGRNAGGGEITFWAGVAQTQGRARVALGILTSKEYRDIVVRSYYANLLKRPAGSPAQSEVDGWSNSPLDITSIRIGFESSQEFFNRVSRLGG